MVTALAVTDMSKVARRFFHLVKGLPTWTVLARSPRLTHAIVGDEASLNALEAEWDDLFKRASAPTPFLRYSWVRLCWERHCAAHDTKLFIVVVRSEGRPVLIAPLVRQKDKLCFLDSLSPQYNDLLVENSVESASYVDYLWRVLSGARRVRRFRAKWVRDDSLLAPHLAKARQVKKVASYPAPFIDLDKFEDWTAYLRSLSKNLRLDHRRQLRKLAKRGQLELRMSNAGACCNDVA
jgi:CelD/BcsL family acetyltransferase involved in cellulose biosynthesis